LACAVESGLDGVRGDFEDLSRLIGSEFFDVAKEKDHAVLLGKLVDAGPHKSADLGLFDAALSDEFPGF